MIWRLLALCLGLLVFATAAAQPVVPEADNFDGSWCTAASKHFVIHTYGGARVARRTLEEAEQSYQALRLALHQAIGLTAGAKPTDDQPPLHIVLFASDYAYNMMVGRDSSGVFRQGLLWGEADFVFLRRVGHYPVLRHELAHRLIRELLPGAPSWLNEGLAQYYQWMQLTEDAINVGSTAELRPVQVKLHDSPYFPPLTQLLSMPRASFYGERVHGLYSASFWLIEALNADAENRARFQQMLKEIAQGARGDKAWQKVFSVEETRRLDTTYRVIREQGAPAPQHIPWQAPHQEVSAARRVTAAEQHLLIARILGRDKGFVARRELDTALQNDAKNAEALAQRALLEPEHHEAQRRDAEQATVLDEKLPLAWQALALAALSAPIARDDAKTKSIAKRLEQFAHSIDSRCLAALLFAALGDRAKAFALAKEVAREAPRNLSAQVVLAYIARSASRAKEAEAALQAAWALSPDGISPSFVESLLLPQLAQANEVTLNFNADKTAAVAANPSSELTAFQQQIQQKIAGFYSPPPNLRALSEAEYTREGAVLTVARITLDEKGIVRAKVPITLSGIAELDEAASAAINRAQPFSPLPPDAAQPLRILLRFSVPLLPPETH